MQKAIFNLSGGGINTDVTGGYTAEIKVYEKILSVAKNLQGKILDIGAGVGTLSLKLQEQGNKEIFACDKYDNFKSVDNIRFKVCDINKGLPYENGYFDVVVCCEVIEHIENPRFITREICRVLKSGGILVLSTPNNLSLSSRLSLFLRGYFGFFGDRSYPAHITALIKKDLIRIINESNFGIEKVLYTDWGRVPRLNLHWQQVFPFFRGELFSDNIIIICKKEIINAKLSRPFNEKTVSSNNGRLC